MRLDHLLEATGTSWNLLGPPGVDVDSIVADSRQVTPGCMFVALRGMGVDGHTFIPSALANGARAVVSEWDVPDDLGDDIAWIQVEKSDRALGWLADAFHGHPSRFLKVLAVTGTNGKTTVTWLLEHILRAAGHRPGLIGTVEIRYGQVSRPSIWTTPLGHVLHAVLGEMRDAGCSHVVLEASSHGIALHRISGVEVAVAGFTNLSRDHMDFHGSMEAYREAKASLFREAARAACFYVDDAVGASLAESYAGPRITVAVDGDDADVVVTELHSTLDGSDVTLRTAEGPILFHLPVIGRHNVENALVALGMANLAGVPLARAADALSTATAAPGRLERVPGERHVVVDYAHTPDALKSVLGCLRPLVAGRLICVFGAGGDRDKGKRPEMGAAVSAFADLAVVTSDNPRSESPEAILDDIVGGLPAQMDRIVEVDRRRAICRAIDLAGPEDLVIVAGKGHEPYQEIDGVRTPFDDRAVARDALHSRQAGGDA